MAIGAIQIPLGASIQAAWSVGKGAKVNTSSQTFALALASQIPAGMYPAGITLLPLVPTGVTAMSSLMTAGLSLGKGSTIASTSKLMAQSISVLAPMCPPIGVGLLGSLIEASMSLGKGAQVATVSKQIASAITLYYMTGGTL